MKKLMIFIAIFTLLFMTACADFTLPQQQTTDYTTDVQTDSQTQSTTVLTTTAPTTTAPTTTVPTTSGVTTTTQITTKALDTELTVKLKHIYNLASESGAFSGTYEDWLETVRGPKGDDGRSVVLNVSEGYVQWKYTDEEEWNNLIPLISMIGPEGEQGVGILDAEINQSGELVITLSDGSEKNLGKILNVYTVQFKDDQGYLIDVQLVTYGQAATAPEPPVKDGYTFSNWDKAFTEIKENTVVKAVYSLNKCRVSFDSAGGSEISDILVEKGKSIILPVITREGYLFAGWFTGNGPNDVQFSHVFPVLQDLELVARWICMQYTLSFESNGGSPVASITQNIGTTVTKPTDPTKEGYSFDGWYSDESLTTAYRFTTMPAENITLYAKWNPIIYGITYVLDNGINGANPSDYTIETAKIILADPTKEGNTFNGWFNNAELTGSQITEIPQGTTGDITLYAKWTVNQYTISFESNGGSPVASITRNFGTTVRRPMATKTGYTFRGWYSDESLTTIYTFTTMPAENITLYAKWRINQYNINYFIFDNFDNWLETGETIVSVSLGDNSPSALTSSGRVFTWGRNFFGQLGDGTTNNRFIPTEITSGFALSEGETIVSVSIGTMHSSALTSSGRVFMWGDNQFGQLGDGTTDDRFTPTEITSGFNLSEGETIVSVSIENMHSSAITSSGRVFMWGDNRFGQLGDGTTENRSTPTEITSGFNLSEGETIVSVSLWGNFSSVLTSSGRVFMWGHNRYGQLGDGTTENRFTPTEITSGFDLSEGETIISVSLWGNFSSVLTSSGRVFMWGHNRYGQLGDGTTENRFTPTEITSGFDLSEGETIVSVLFGAMHSSAFTSSGRVFTWGQNDLGQLGDGTTDNRFTPTEITSGFALSEGETIVSVSLGSYHSSALTSSGRVFMWGSNNNGQLGDGTTDNRSTPTEITSGFDLSEGETIVSLSLRNMYSSALTSSGRVLMWGSNNNGQLGDGSTADRSTPTESIFRGNFSFETETFDYNEALTEYAPTREGYTLDGWYSDVAFTTEYVFTTMPAANITLYAKWVAD